MRKYDYLIVGAGLFGSVFAHEAGKRGKRCLVIDRRAHIGGNVYTEERAGIQVHLYGAHIFHTDDREIWDYVGRFAEFNRYTNAPIALFGGEVYNLPFNMNTFYKVWGTVTPDEARARIAAQRSEAGIDEPRNLEEQAISLVGRDIYERLVKGYTEKQWGRSARELPPWIIRRLPVRFTYDNSYFSDRYQGIPMGGYTRIVEGLLAGADVELGVDFCADRAGWEDRAERVLYTGRIDEYFDYALGTLTYRSLRFVHETLDTPNYQGNAVVNYTAADVPYTRIIEHRHFDDRGQEKTVVTREYPAQEGEPYYPVNDAANDALYARYRERAAGLPRVLFGGRLAEYRYYDMDDVIRSALDLAQKALFQ